MKDSKKINVNIENIILVPTDLKNKYIFQCGERERELKTLGHIIAGVVQVRKDKRKGGYLLAFPHILWQDLTRGLFGDTIVFGLFHLLL